MRPNVVLSWVLLGHCIMISVYEVWALTAKGPDWTVTHVLRKWSREFAILPLLIGILLGHLFFCRHPMGDNLSGGGESKFHERDSIANTTDGPSC